MPAFDTHQRLSLLKRFLEHVLEAEGEVAPSVLDIGGFPGLLAQELGDVFRSVTIDSARGRLPDYVRASGCQLPFGDARFDAVVASDVLEHVPSERRQQFLAEAARVSRAWIFLGGPFRSPEVAQAEAAVNALTRLTQGRANPWLDEHWQCGLPDLENTRAGLKTLGFQTAVVPNGSLFSWFLLKETELLLHALPNAFQKMDDLNDLYIRLWSEFDHQRPTYRHLLIAHRSVDRVEALMESPPPRCGLQFFGPATAVPAGGGETPRIRAAAELFERLAAALADGSPAPLESGFLNRLEAIVQSQEEQHAADQVEIESLRRRLAEYEGSRVVRAWRRLRRK